MKENENVMIDLSKAELSLLYIAHDGWLVKISNPKYKEIHLGAAEIKVIEDLTMGLIRFLAEHVKAE